MLLFPTVRFVSVPLRGKEGAGPDLLSEKDCLLYLFPSPCGVRRVRDGKKYESKPRRGGRWVSVPLRGKEGAGPISPQITTNK